MTVTLVVSDLHVNSTVSVCKPETPLDDGGTYHLSPGQQWLWKNWEELIRLATACAAKEKLILVCNGDICEGDTKNRSKQLITRNRATITKMTVDVIEPLVKLAAHTFVIRGTGAHVGKSGEAEEAIANDIEADGPSESVHSWYQLPLVVDGVRMDIAHKTTGGGLPWTARNAALRLAAKTLFEYADRREVLPHLVIRSHIHRLGDSHDAYAVRALITPCFTLATEYIHEIAPSALADIGAIFIHTQLDKGMSIWKFHPVPQRRQWKNC